MRTRAVLLILLLGNLVVLLGQLWPEGAPPFARYVNVAVLSLDALLVMLLLRERRR